MGNSYMYSHVLSGAFSMCDNAAYHTQRDTKLEMDSSKLPVAYHTGHPAVYDDQSACASVSADIKENCRILSLVTENAGMVEIQ